jgi:hypothetical protein
MKSTKLLVAVVVLQSLVLLGQWTGGGGVPLIQRAEAQIPDAGGQRQQIIDELKGLNAKVDKLIDVLDSGKLNVKATVEEKK